MRLPKWGRCDEILECGPGKIIKQSKIILLKIKITKLFNINFIIFLVTQDDRFRRYYPFDDRLLGYCVYFSSSEDLQEEVTEI